MVVIPGPAGLLRNLYIANAPQDAIQSMLSDVMQPSMQHSAVAVQSHSMQGTAQQYPSWESALNCFEIPLTCADHPILAYNIAWILAQNKTMKVSRVLAVVSHMQHLPFGSIHATLKDHTGCIKAIIHSTTLEKHPALTTGATLALRQVSVVWPSATDARIIITTDNVTQVFSPSSSTQRIHQTDALPRGTTSLDTTQQQSQLQKQRQQQQRQQQMAGTQRLTSLTNEQQELAVRAQRAHLPAVQSNIINKLPNQHTPQTLQQTQAPTQLHTQLATQRPTPTAMTQAQALVASNGCPTQESQDDEMDATQSVSQPLTPWVALRPTTHPQAQPKPQPHHDVPLQPQPTSSYLGATSSMLQMGKEAKAQESVQVRGDACLDVSQLKPRQQPTVNGTLRAGDKVGSDTCSLIGSKQHKTRQLQPPQVASQAHVSSIHSVHMKSNLQPDVAHAVPAMRKRQLRIEEDDDEMLDLGDDDTDEPLLNAPQFQLLGLPPTGNAKRFSQATQDVPQVRKPPSLEPSSAVVVSDTKKVQSLTSLKAAELSVGLQRASETVSKCMAPPPTQPPVTSQKPHQQPPVVDVSNKRPRCAAPTPNHSVTAGYASSSVLSLFSPLCGSSNAININTPNNPASQPPSSTFAVPNVPIRSSTTSVAVPVVTAKCGNVENAGRLIQQRNSGRQLMRLCDNDDENVELNDD